MMEFFPEIEQIFPLDDQHEVTVRKLTFGERMAAFGNARSKAEGDGRGAFVFLRLEMTRLAVKSWRGPQLDKVPCTPENIARLGVDVGLQISDFVMSLNGLLDEEEGGGGEEDDDSEKNASGATTSS